MASYNVSRRPNGKWRARYRGPDNRERSRHFDRKTDAERWARTEVARLDRGEWTSPELGRLTVGEYSREWLESKVRIRPSTRLMYDVVLRNQVLPTWAGVRLAAVRHEDVAAWVAQLHGNGLSAARTRHAWVVLSQILEFGVRSHRIPNNQAKGVELPALPSKSERDKTRFLNEREVWLLAEAAGEFSLSVLVLAWCGLRFGELAALRCSSLDVGARELRVSATLSESNGKLVEGPPKTETSNRTVPVPAWLCDEFAAGANGRAPDDYLLTSPQGGPLRSGNWRYRVFDPAVRKPDSRPSSAATCSARTTCGTPARRCTSSTERRRKCSPRCSDTPPSPSLSIAMVTSTQATCTCTSTGWERLRWPHVRTICGQHGKSGLRMEGQGSPRTCR